jgi:hypothetical protein
MTREEVKSLFALLFRKVKFVHSRSGLSVLLAILLSGCGTNLDTTQSTERIQNQESTSVGTNGQLISIQSGNVRAAGYDASVLVMTVQFNSGYVYEYYGVQPELWNSFIAAQPNPWSQVGYPRLVQAMVPYKRIR